MNSDLEKIDIIRNRCKLGYEESRDVLNAASGDVVEALVLAEQRHADCSDLISLGAELFGELRGIIDNGPARRLRVKYGNRVLKETPVALTAAAALAVGLAAVLISKLVIEVDTDEGEST